MSQEWVKDLLSEFALALNDHEYGSAPEGPDLDLWAARFLEKRVENRRTKGKPWIGVDLDGTLAHYDGWKGIDQIGEPIEEMLARVIEWVARGIEVKIMTARVAEEWERELCIEAIEEWCLKHIGEKLEVTATKDLNMIELWDDRAVQVVPNMGVPIAQVRVHFDPDKGIMGFPSA